MTDASATPIYMDNAATSFPKPEAVYAAVDTYMRDMGVAYGRGSHSAASDAARLVSQCRHRLSLIVGAESSDRIAFTFNCTDGLNLLLRGLLRRNDRVITSTLEHNSVLRPLQQLQTELDLDVVRVDFNTDNGVVDTESLLRELNNRPTRLVVLNHASNVTGVVQPVASVTAAAHQAGALLLLDAAQTVGHIPLNVQDLNVDFLASAGHKGLLGPLGTGFVYVRDGLDNELLPIRCGGTGTNSESLHQPDQMPTKLESGNMNMPGLAGLNAAAEWLLQRSVEVVHGQLQEHWRSLSQSLHAIDGVSVYPCGQSDNVGIVSFTVDGMDCQDVAAVLDQSFQIRCRAGLHCAPLVHDRIGTAVTGGTVRLSPGPFTMQSDVDAAVAAVSQLAQSIPG